MGMNSFGTQQADTPAYGNSWDSSALTGILNNKARSLWNSDVPAREFGIQQSYNAMNSPNSSMLSGTTLGANPYQAASPDWFSMGGAFGNGQTGGWVSPALKGLQSLFSWTQGNKALDLAEDQFKFNKEITQKNLANQTSLLNTSMRARQNARRAASSSYQDTDSYMREHGL